MSGEMHYLLSSTQRAPSGAQHPHPQMVFSPTAELLSDVFLPSATKMEFWGHLCLFLPLLLCLYTSTYSLSQKSQKLVNFLHPNGQGSCSGCTNLPAGSQSPRNPACPSSHSLPPTAAHSLLWLEYHSTKESHLGLKLISDFNLGIKAKLLTADYRVVGRL